MNRNASTWTDQKLEVILGRLLRWSVLVAASVVFLGGVLYLIERGGGEPHQQTFHAQPPELCNPRGIIGEAFAGHSRGLIQLGLLLLIATPIARVLLSAIGFFMQGDRLYVAVTVLVLAVLLFSLMGRHSLPGGG